MGTKISAEPNASTLSGTEKVLGLQTGADVQIDVSDIANLADPATIGADVAGAAAAAESAAESHADAGDATEASARSSADSAESSARIAGDASTLAAAESYADADTATEASARASGDSATLASAETYADSDTATEAAARAAGDATRAQALTPVSITYSSSPYTASAGQFVRVDSTGGPVVVILDHTAPDQSRWGVKEDIGTNGVTVQTGGSDVFNKIGGSTTYSLPMLNQSAMFQRDATNAIIDIQDTDFPASNSILSGSTQLQSISARVDLAAGYTLPHPNLRTRLDFNVQYPAGAGACWIKLCELICGDASATAVLASASFGAGSAQNSVPNVSGNFASSIRVTAGNTFASASHLWVGGQLNTSVYLRAYRDVDGSSRNRLTLYIYNPVGTSDGSYYGTLDLQAGHADDIINVWQTGAAATATDPAGTMTEIARQCGIGSVAAQSARAFFNSAGGATDPARMTTNNLPSGTTSYSITAADHMTTIRATSATAFTGTVNGSALGDGFYCEIVQDGAGQVLIAQGSGMTQEGGGTAKSRALGSVLQIRGYSNTLYNVGGDMSAS